ncbi:tRNA-dihydrouridine synthase [Maledivibacter halophilus]|uniref:Dihydroorotate dehydrogenase B (NAD(+)), catalytic subunit n=1 Tax=Maledivibacter halophilus TaxID=36842 RepID=A0A1T5IUD5_9FIRM|nr:tRNA-dihydrouridine synthase [Maledivibacter halophilus]SKC42598.1 dihydroorotate dehydrogenase (subfamily 1) family protein [Maledivibacter halophilus]
MDLKVSFMGLKLKNPIIVAAGPLTASGKMIKKAIDAGAGAVVTKTIVNEVRSNVRPRLVANKYGMQNIELYSEYSLEEWENEISYAKENDGIVIANILAHTPSEMAYIASRVEKFGADAIELGISSPNGEGIEVLGSNPNKLYDFTKSVVARVNIPVMVKLSSNVTNLARLAKAAEKAGASAISGIDTVRGILGVDIEKKEALLPTYGGYSGAGIRPIGLAAVSTISQAVNISVSGIGGIINYKHVLEYIMLGATTVQMCTGLILNGVENIKNVLSELESWMNRREYNSIDDIKGAALRSLKSYEEIKLEPYGLKSRVFKCHVNCDKCVKACAYEAITKQNDRVYVESKNCTGCGLCVSLCDSRKFNLEWINCL